jgi:Domain of unknown function (DUF4864)
MPGLRAGAALMHASARRRTMLWFMSMLCALGAALPNTPGSAAEPDVRAGDWKAIRAVIAQQRSAFLAGDAAKAFSYASPGIKAQFGDAATFIAMVRSGYAALLSARYVEFLEGAVIDGTVIQPLRLIETDNTVRVALYTMEKQKNGVWRISGCHIAPSTVQAT